MRNYNKCFTVFLSVCCIILNYNIAFAGFSKSDDKDYNDIFDISAGGYNYTVDTSSSSYGTHGSLYVNGKYIDDDVYWRFIAEGPVVYYEKFNYNTVYRYDAETDKNEYLFYDSECFLEGCYKDKYLYYSTDKYSNDCTDLGIVIYDLINKREITCIESGSIVEVADNKIFILPNTGDLYPLDIKMAEPDGSNLITIANDASEMKVINNRLYYSALEFDSYHNAQECVRCYDIVSGNTITLTDCFNGIVRDFYEDHVTVSRLDANSSTIYDGSGLFDVYYNTSNEDVNTNILEQNQDSVIADSGNSDNTAVNIPYTSGDFAEPESFMYDMDCDGVEDSISVYEEWIDKIPAVYRVHVVINGCEYVRDESICWLEDVCIVDINKADKAKEIVLTETYHGTVWSEIIRYENNEIKELLIDNVDDDHLTTVRHNFVDDDIDIYVPGDGTLLISGEAVNIGDHFQVNDWYQEFHRGILTRMYGAPNKDETISVVLDGSELIFDQPPIIKDDRTLVPLRAIFEALGATVAWDGNTQTVTAQKGDIIIKLTIGTYEFYKNNDSISLDVPSMIVNDRTLVPVRAISEALDCDVDWDGDTRTVHIYSDSSNQDLEGELLRYAKTDLLKLYQDDYAEKNIYTDVRFLLADVSGDDEPELLAVGVIDNELCYLEIYQYNNGNVVNILKNQFGYAYGGVMDLVWYDGGIRILYESGSSSNGFMKKLMKYENGNWEVIYNTSFDLDNEGNLKGYIVNGEYVAEAEFESVRESVEMSLVTISDFRPLH